MTRGRHALPQAAMLTAGLLICAALLPILVDAQASPARFSRSIPVASSTVLAIEADDGSVTVSGTDGRIASIEVRIRQRDEEPGDRQGGLVSGLSVTGGPDRQVVRMATQTASRTGGSEGGGGRGGILFDWSLRVPRDVTVEIRSTRGSISVTDTGPVLMESTDGDLSVTGVIGGLTAASVNGSITVQGCRDGTDVSSVSGDIRLRGVQGMIRATCISGTVTIEEVGSRDVRVSNTGGDIVYTGRVEPEGRYTLGSHSGAIMFTLLGEHGIVANLSTFSGDIITPLDLILTGPRTSRRALTGLLGDGSATVTITAFSGDITLRKR